MWSVFNKKYTANYAHSIKTQGLDVMKYGYPTGINILNRQFTITQNIT